MITGTIAVSFSFISSILASMKIGVSGIATESFSTASIEDSINTGAEGISSSMLLIIEPMNIGSSGIKAALSDDALSESITAVVSEESLGDFSS